jgi:hypothetical protein
MDPATVSLIIALVGLAAKYGVPFVHGLFEALEKGEITPADIENLKLNLKLTKRPEDFGKDDGGGDSNP